MGPEDSKTGVKVRYAVFYLWDSDGSLTRAGQFPCLYLVAVGLHALRVVKRMK